MAESWGVDLSTLNPYLNRTMKRQRVKRRARNRSTPRGARGHIPTPPVGGSYRAPAPPPPIRTTSTGRYSPPAPPPSGNAPGRVAEVKPPPKPPSVGRFLNRDTGYQQQLRDLARTFSDFEADVTRRRGGLKTETAESRRALGQQRGKDLEALEEDFGSRGLVRSGLYAGAVGDYESEFGERMTDLESRLKEALAQLEQERGQFGGKQKAERQRAREQAIRRRAEKYGL